MADYYVDKNGNITRKKRKQSDYYVKLDGTIRRTTRQKNTSNETEEKTSGLDFFKKGTFEDGWQFGDIAKAIIATNADINAGIAKGAAKTVGGIIDAGTYGVAAVLDAFGADKAADGTREFARRNIVDEYFSGELFGEDSNNSYGKNLDDMSILGRTSDAVAEGLGQVLLNMTVGGAGTAIGIGAKGVTALTAGTMGLSSVGSGISEAYEGGATDGEATAYGISKGVIDAGSELIFGGLGKAVNALGYSRGLSSLDDMAAKKLSDTISKKIANETAKRVVGNTVEFAVKSGAEGLEEVIAGSFSAAAKKLTYMDEESLGDLIKDENLLEQFVVGAVTSGLAQGGELIVSVKNGKESVTALTPNEQKVVDKEVENRITLEEADGGKLTAKEKTQIRDAVMKDLDEGGISIDTIESVLGKDAVAEYESLARESDEFNTLYETESGKLTEKQKDRLAELKKINAATPYESALKAKREEISQGVYELARDSRLIESYNERSRKGEAFTADLTKYSEKQRFAVQRAIDSGILNNTKKTHNFVDLIAKISADKDVSFDFTNNAKLKESGFDLDGKTVNGYVTGNGITVNVNSARALNSVVGHEITHVLEETELYGELQSAIFEYARTKGDYEGRLRDVTELYKGVEGANVDAELTADLVGEYLFTDAEFVSRLSAENKNVFVRIYEEIKYLCRVATAKSKEAKALEKVKKVFDDAYGQTAAQKNTAEDGGVKYSISKDIDGNIFVDITENIFDANNGESVARTIQRVISERFDNLIEANGQKIQINKKTNDEFRRSESANALLKNPSEAYNDKLKTIANADEIMIAAKNWIGEKINHVRTDDIVEFARGNIMYRVGENGYVADVIVGIRRNEAAVLYDLVNIYDKKITEAPVTMASQNDPQRRQDASVAPILSQPDTDVNTKLSLGGDPSGDTNGYRVIGRDVMLDDLGPVRDDIALSGALAPAQRFTEVSGPVRDDIEPVTKESEAANNEPSATKTAPTEENSAAEADPEPITTVKEKLTEQPGQDNSKEDRLETRLRRIDRRVLRERDALAEEFRVRKEEMQKQLSDKSSYVSGKADELYREIRQLKKGVRASGQLGELLDYGYGWSDIKQALLNVKARPGETVNPNSAVESVAREIIGRDYESKLYELDDIDNEYQRQLDQLEADAESERSAARKEEQLVRRKELHEGKIDEIKTAYSDNGLNFDDVLGKAKDLKTFTTVDNTPQRVMEKALGYKEGGILADLTVNRVAQHETEAIKWLNRYTGKDGVLAELSKKYRIRPGSKESAAAQMYAEGFFVNKNNEIIEYGSAELAQDFPDEGVRERIVGLATDPAVRQIYDDTLKLINESRTRNGYPEVPKRDNYHLHFRAMSDTFSKLGIPFNPNDIRAKDLPTDLNGVTADLKPGQPYFPSAMRRRGKRTSFDLLGGVEQYLTSAKGQIFHIDDIQTLRALRNYIAEKYGQASGLDGLEALTDEEIEEKIRQIYGSHLSTFAKFLNEEANIIAGKTALIDRGVEGVIGRRGITFLNTVNKQVGSNMVGFNVSSAGTNFLPIVQALAKTNKTAFIKALAETASNKVKSIFGKSDNFAGDSSVVVRRRGAERFYRTPYAKIADAGYALMSAVDNVSTELIARAKYNELIGKNVDPEKAHYETDKWVSRLMGDRSLGQQPQLYNSKMLGLITKFQLEVRNQLDSQFYDTVKEAQYSNEEIENKLVRNAKTAAKVTSTFVQLAVLQHLFGQAYESVAGYNPAFDIIDVIVKTFGFDDEEDDEDTALDNVEEGFLALLEDLPYTSTFTGGRIPISSALPISEIVTGEDEYGNEVSRGETAIKALPYYVLPGGYSQLRKTIGGHGMFDEDLPTSGSYTDSGDLRFPVEDSTASKLQAAIFGQWASENAREYIEEERRPLSEKQIREFLDVGMSIHDYWEYREGLSDLDTIADKADYIAGLDLTDEQKNILINNVSSRKEPIDLSDYDKYPSFEAFELGTSDPGAYALAEAVGGYDEYMKYKTYISDIKPDYDSNGKIISESRKAKVVEYLNTLDVEYGERLLLFRSIYPGDDTYNLEIVDYLNSRDDIDYDDIVAVLTKLGFTVAKDGTVTW